MNKTKDLKKKRERVIKILSCRSGEGYVDTAVKLIVAVVIGGLLLTGMYYLFNSIVLPNMAGHIQNMFT